MNKQEKVLWIGLKSALTSFIEKTTSCLHSNRCMQSQDLQAFQTGQLGAYREVKKIMETIETLDKISTDNENPRA